MIMRYKKKSLWLFGALIAGFLFMVVKCSSYENQAQNNVENCEKVDIDMSMEQVVEIMGKPDNVKTYQGKINYTDMKITKYYYNAPSGSSVGVNIFFNAQSKKVVRTECKD
ncbi:MAG: hypothetical protein ACOXZH_10120 [Bacteroidales bacterium]|jgi:transcriptional regulator of nitric oxide reductase